MRKFPKQPVYSRVHVKPPPTRGKPPDPPLSHACRPVEHACTCRASLFSQTAAAISMRKASASAESSEGVSLQTFSHSSIAPQINEVAFLSARIEVRTARENPAGVSDAEQQQQVVKGREHASVTLPSRSPSHQFPDPTPSSHQKTV